MTNLIRQDTAKHYRKIMACLRALRMARRRQKEIEYMDFCYGDEIYVEDGSLEYAKWLAVWLGVVLVICVGMYLLKVMVG